MTNKMIMKAFGESLYAKVTIVTSSGLLFQTAVLAWKKAFADKKWRTHYGLSSYTEGRGRNYFAA